MNWKIRVKQKKNSVHKFAIYVWYDVCVIIHKEILEQNGGYYGQVKNISC